MTKVQVIIQRDTKNSVIYVGKGISAMYINKLALPSPPPESLEVTYAAPDVVGH